MPEATGNVWIDPDTGKPANPGNVIAGEGPIAPEEKYGIGVLGNPEPPVATTVVEGVPSRDVSAVAGQVPQQRPLDAVERPEYGAGVTGEEAMQEAQDHRDEIQVIERIRTLRETQKAGNAREKQAATEAMTVIAKREYARTDGGRPSITKRLAAYGISKE